MKINKLKILKRKERYVLTWQGKILVLVIVALGCITFAKTIPLFLSINKPIYGNVLLLDGQMPDFAIEKAIKIFKEGNYDVIITTGGQIPSGYYIADIKTMAELNQATFLKLGFPEERIVALPSGRILRNRTYNSALTSKKWFIENNSTFKKIDVLAIGAHARRSRLLFQKALGKDFEVGIISIDDPAYDASKWWNSSIGSRVMISETIAYTYARIIF